MRKDFYVKRSVAGQKTSVCSRAGSRSCVSSVELKPEARTRLRRAPALIRGGHDFCAQRPRRGLVTGGRTAAASTGLRVRRSVALTLRVPGAF